MLRELHEVMGQDAGMTLGAMLGSLGIIAATIITVTSVVATQWRAVRQSEDVNALKQDMLDRGMPADEIATVIEASSKSMWARHVFGSHKPYGRSCNSNWASNTAAHTHEQPQTVS